MDAPMMALFVAALVLAAALAMLIPKKKKRTVRIRTPDRAAEYHNRMVQETDKVSALFARRLDMKQREAVLYHDAYAFRQLEHIVSKFDQGIEPVREKLSESVDRIKRGDDRGSREILDGLEKDLEALRGLYEALGTVSVNKQRVEDHTDRAPEPEPAPKGSASFFDGCKNQEEMVARYRALAKAFHPDSKGGDPGMFRLLKEEYDRLTKATSA